MTQTIVANQYADYSHDQLIAALVDRDQEIASLERQLLWHERLYSNRGMKPNQKAAFYGAVRAVQRGIAREDGYTPVYRDAIADIGGISKQSVSDTLSLMADQAIIQKKNETGMSEEGEFKNTLALLIPPAIMDDPSKIVLKPGKDKKTGKDKEEWGGTRIKICRDCHTEMVEKHYFMCTNPDCGSCGVAVAPDDVLEMSQEALGYIHPEISDEELAPDEAAHEAYHQQQQQEEEAKTAISPELVGKTCSRCGETWKPVIHPTSGRKVCACHSLTREELKARKQPQQQSIFNQ